MLVKVSNVLPAALVFSLATAIEIPQLLPFLSALSQPLHNDLPDTLQNVTAHELLKRQSNDGCPNGFDSCQNLGAANLCCMTNAVCSADQAGNVACCPTGAVCTGTIGGVIYSGTVNGGGGIVGATGTANSGGGSVVAATTTAAQSGLVQATTQTTGASGEIATATGGGFIVAGTSTVAQPASAARDIQLVSNSFKRMPWCELTGF